MLAMPLDIASAEQLASMALAVVGPGSTEERIRTVDAALNGPGGEVWRNQIAEWIGTFVPVENMVPQEGPWRHIVRDAIRFVFARLSVPRLAAKIIEQLELPPATPPEQRMLRLISRMPALQKLGQVLARNPRLAPAARDALTELENGISDVTPRQIRDEVERQLGPLLNEYQVRIDSKKLSEASVSAVIGFTYRIQGRERERGVFKVLKGHIPACFAEDMSLLQDLAAYTATRGGVYDFAVKEISDSLSEVRLLLEHELDYVREQNTLLDAWRCYRSSIGIRVPRLIRPLCTTSITAMSAETGVKVTDALRWSPTRRTRVAEQLIEAIIAVPLFSREEDVVFHGDPHAGNLLYDEPNRELVLLDWALADRLSLEARRQLVLLAVMTILRNPEGVARAIQLLALSPRTGRRKMSAVIETATRRYFRELPAGHAPGAIDAMMLLDLLALQGVRFPPALFLFRKVVFTLDGVLHDVAGPGVRLDQIIAREFLTRWASSFGLFHAPLEMNDLLSLPWNALLYPARSWLGNRLARRSEPVDRRQSVTKE
jgi:ubiquinone biosynthesis protein